MGYSLSWLAVKGRSPQSVRAELGLNGTGRREECPESDLSSAELPGGWYLIVNLRTERVAPDSALQRLSSDGAELVTCFVEEHVMVSTASGWKDGRELWSLLHDAQHGTDHLLAKGDLPPAFPSIRDRLLSCQREENARKPRSKNPRFKRVIKLEELRCDYVFNVPVETARSLTGYQHDREIPELNGQPFEVLQPDPLTGPRQPAKRSFWRRLFGA